LKLSKRFAHLNPEQVRHPELFYSLRRIVHSDPGAHSAFCLMRTGGKAVPLVPNLRKRGAIPPLFHTSSWRGV